MEKCIVPEILNQPLQQHHWKHHKNLTYFDLSNYTSQLPCQPGKDRLITGEE